MRQVFPKSKCLDFRIMKKLSDFIIYGNFLIAICATGLIWESYILLHVPAQPFYLVTGFVATLFIYNIDRLVVLDTLSGTGNDRHKWVVLHYKLMRAISIASLAFLCISLFFMPLSSVLFLAHLGIISLGYSVPAFFMDKKGLRNIKLLKIFLIMYVWAATTVLWPAISAGIPVLRHNIIMLFIERALFIFALTLPFDIRDYQTDKESHVITIPGAIGIPNTRLLGFICILVFFLINLAHYDTQNAVLWAKLVSGISALFALYFTHPSRHEYYFTGLIDGLMLLQFGLVVVAVW